MNNIPATAVYPQFLQNLNTQIEEHLSDDSLTIKKLTRLAGMSRTNLHRKLTKTIGMSATRYLRFVRLNRAARLLLDEPEWSIYQVALEVGFGSQSYFSTRFRELFNMSPGKWRIVGGKLEHLE